MVVELKAGAIKPEYAGQLNFYLAAIDAQMKEPQDEPTIGLLLCKQRKRLIAEYALRGIDSPMGVAQHRLIEALPERLVDSLPSVGERERELGSS